MAEYIKFEATKQAIDRIRSVYHRARNFNAVSVIDNVFGEIKEIPAADVAPVVHSKWEICCDGYYPYCKHCRNEPQGRVMTKFCPNCGAKMDEEG